MYKQFEHQNTLWPTNLFFKKPQQYFQIFWFILSLLTLCRNSDSTLQLLIKKNIFNYSIIVTVCWLSLTVCFLLKASSFPTHILQSAAVLHTEWYLINLYSPPASSPSLLFYPCKKIQPVSLLLRPPLSEYFLNKVFFLLSFSASFLEKDFCSHWRDLWAVLFFPSFLTAFQWVMLSAKKRKKTSLFCCQLTFFSVTFLSPSLEK